jgi:arabinan endo-1,5-alpha-L-arabinosidase
MAAFSPHLCYLIPIMALCPFAVRRWKLWRALVLAVSGLSAISAEIPATGPSNNSPPLVRQRGQFVHDPSTITKCGSEYWVFSTGPGIVSWHSRDLKKWDSGPHVFETAPSWTTNAVPGFRGYFWAPDVLHVGDRYLLFYSVSSWGKNTSAIGLVTNPTLDPKDPGFAWTDQGPVVQSGPADPFNTIDPSVFEDRNGALWLAFGSFWTGIKLVELDRNTGKRVAADSPISSLAFSDSIEAPCLWRRGDFYYLLANWGLCCRGTNSTYHIRVGRSLRVTGPYLDKDGKDLLQQGGTLLLGSEGKRVGPGHAGIYQEGGLTWLSFHYYDADRSGRATLAVRQLDWTAEGWPALRLSP